MTGTITDAVTHYVPTACAWSACRALHVSPDHPKAADTHPGTADLPLATISAAARIARAGDTVLVHPGIYRERIAPAAGGCADHPLTFRAVIAHQAVIRGSDIYQGPWYTDHHFPACLTAHPPFAPDSAFRMPARAIPGDRVCGQIFINGQLLHQGASLDDLSRPSCQGAWRWLDCEQMLVVRPPSGVDPRHAHVELSVRNRLFAPHLRGLGHIIVEGFVFEHCANQSCGGFWEASGYPQAGAVSTRSGHHWTIRNCIIRDVNSIGIDCGNEGAYDVEGNQPAAPEDSTGWHTIQANHIYDCGEAGIVGHTSTATRVLGNRIERCNCMGFNAVEEAGIKFHSFVGGLVEGNLLIDNECHGIWLDNVWRGARVTGNVVLNSKGSGIFIEMGYGPCLVDTNIVAFTRQGEGIYTHDSSGVTVAHNLLYANTHFGVYMRTVSERPVQVEDGTQRQVATRDQHIVNNVFIDNYRGHISLPADLDGSYGNRSDYNLFINGAQWHWEGLGFHRFVLNTSDGRIDRGAVAERLVQSLSSAGGSSQRVFVECWLDQPYLTFGQWQGLTGNDLHSSAPSADAGQVANGAVQKGDFSLSAAGLYLEVRNPSMLTSAKVANIKGVERDFYGYALPESPLPGPFQRLVTGGPQVLSLEPRCPNSSDDDRG